MTIEEQISTEVHHLPPNRQQEVLDFVEFLRQRVGKEQGPRPYGLCRGEFTVPEDFDAPLPQEILDAFSWFPSSSLGTPVLQAPA